MLNYIREKEVFGKAHIAYGLFRTDAIVRTIRRTAALINRHYAVENYPQIDVLMNGVLLSYGDLVTSDLCLRKFSYGPRKGPASKNRTFLERVLKYENHTLDYFDAFLPVIDEMMLGDGDKARLRRAVLQRKINFIMERIGRRLFVYKIYWHFKKRFCFKPVSS